MSAKVKKAGRIGTKIIAVLLFVFLVIFNVQMGVHDVESGDISLFGLSLSLFIPDAVASDCSEYGYRNWDWWVSGVSGLDCWCTERRKVVNPCK
jgi:hypothetical protein